MPTPKAGQPCEWPDCTRAIEVRDWCYMHYNSGLVNGDIKPICPLDRYWSQVDKHGPIPEYDPSLGPCWIWTGSPSNTGYGRFSMDGKRKSAHVWALEFASVEIPEGHEVDHLCRVQLCVNPSHLEPVTMYENVMRGISFSAENKRKTHCARGHEYNEENTRTTITPAGTARRKCRVCERENAARYKSRKMEELNAES